MKDRKSPLPRLRNNNPLNPITSNGEPDPRLTEMGYDQIFKIKQEVYKGGVLRGVNEFRSCSGVICRSEGYDSKGLLHGACNYDEKGKLTTQEAYKQGAIALVYHIGRRSIKAIDIFENGRKRTVRKKQEIERIRLTFR